MFTYVYICVYVCIYKYTYIHTYICTCIHAYIHDINASKELHPPRHQAGQLPHRPRQEVQHRARPILRSISNGYIIISMMVIISTPML